MILSLQFIFPAAERGNLYTIIKNSRFQEIASFAEKRSLAHVPPEEHRDGVRPSAGNDTVNLGVYSF